jgi:hypothetical protein
MRQPFSDCNVRKKIFNLGSNIVFTYLHLAYHNELLYMRRPGGIWNIGHMGTADPHLITRHLWPLQPCLFPELCRQRAHERRRRNAVEEGAASADHHAPFASTEHNVSPAYILEEAQFVRANEGNNDVILFVA